MNLIKTTLMRMFGRPHGMLGRLGGRIMARMNAECGAWVSGLLEIGPKDRILEVGFGPGVVIDRLARLAPQGRVAGIDPSPEMVAQARARNLLAIRRRHVDLREGSVESLPFDDNSFDKAIAINAMQVWRDPITGLREIGRVLKPGGVIALGFTRYSGQSPRGLTETLEAAGFLGAHIVVRNGRAFCALAAKP
jgi:ubiquinone/menaquinone biosynthesis C-methylase UbiE